VTPIGGEFPATVPPDVGAGWELTRAISPRDTVRTAVPEADGHYSNEYATAAAIAGPAPTGPWAMYLADPAGYRFLGFDLDAKRGNAGRDAGRLSLWLDECSIEHVVAASGPSGGRHVWIALDEPAAPTLVRELADLAGSLLPSLDKTPLTNPATGCLRPPGAPHRDGGISAVVRGRIETLQVAPTTLDELEQLRALLVDAGADVETPLTSIVRGMAIDVDGQPHLIGQRREPSARIRALLAAAPDADTSTTQAAVLVGLARARWRFRDVLELLHTSPALEHSRTRARGAARVPVAADVARRRLSADWRRAVYYVASNPVAGDTLDEDFQARASAATDAVRALEERADSMPGLWGLDGPSQAARRRRGRYSQRAVLRALSLYLVQAARPIVEVDVRRLAQDTGYGREACRTALLALSTPTVPGDPESAWIVLVDHADGPHGATYRLSARFSTAAEERKWSQVATRPAAPSAGADSRSWWIRKLTTELQSIAQDVFAAPHSLGRTAGRSLHTLASGTVRTAADVAADAGLSVDAARRSLRRLAQHGLAERHPGGWSSRPETPPDAVAIALEVDGYLEARAERYRIERGAWGWWQAEVTWLRRRDKRRRKRPGATTATLFSASTAPDFPRYPRAGNQPDHALARALIRAGALERSSVAA